MIPLMRPYHTCRAAAWTWGGWIVTPLFVLSLLIDPAIVSALEPVEAGHRGGPAQQGLFVLQAMALRGTSQLDAGLAPTVAKADLFRNASEPSGLEIPTNRQQNAPSEVDRLVFKHLNAAASAEDLASLLGISLYPATIAFSLLKSAQGPRQWQDFVLELDQAVALPDNFARRTTALFARLLRAARASPEKAESSGGASRPKSGAGDPPAKPNLKDNRSKKASALDARQKRLDTAKILAGRIPEFPIKEFLKAFWEDRRRPAMGDEFIRDLESWAQELKND